MATRKIIDIEQNGEKVWPKGHAKATYMSDGSTVEDAINQIGVGGITVETDPIFSASPAASITEAKKAEWNNKVDKVSGKQLSTEDFTTALKSKLEGLSNYDDTEIESAITSLQNQFNTLVSGNASDAINSFNEIIAFLNGIEDSESLDSIIASIEQQIAGKQDKLISGTNIKTINGTSILGSGDIEISGSEGGGSSNGRNLVSRVDLIFSEGDPLLPDTTYYCNDVVAIDISAVTPPSGDYAEYTMLFQTDEDVYITCPDNWLWANGQAPSVEGNTVYELSVVATKFGNDYIYKAVLTPFKSVE